MSAEYDRLFNLINQCRQQKARGIVHKANDEESYLAARIENGIPVDIRSFQTEVLAKQHALG